MCCLLVLDSVTSKPQLALETLVEGRAAKTELVRIVLAFLFHKYSKVVVKNFITTPVVVKNSITTSPLRHRQRGNMTRPPVPKPPATTTYSLDSPARRHDRQEGEGWATGA